MWSAVTGFSLTRIFIHWAIIEATARSNVAGRVGLDGVRPRKVFAKFACARSITATRGKYVMS